MMIEAFMPCRRGARPRPAAYRGSFRRLGSIVAVGLGVLSIAGCEKKPTGPEPPAVNSDAPNANARIVSQQVFGAPGKLSYVRTLESADAASQWFLGELDGVWGVGRLGAAGNLVWHSSLGHSPWDLVALSSSSPMPGGAIAVGDIDSDGDGKIDAGCATLITAAGGIAHRQLYGSADSVIRLSAIAALSDSLFVVAGRERTAGVTSPFVALLALSAADTLEKRPQEVIASLAGQMANDVTTDPGDALAPSRRIYLSTGLASGYNTITLHGIDISASTLAPWSLAWTRTLSGKGPAAIRLGMRVFDGALYVAGWTDDPDKGTPSNGGFWTSGIVARLSRNGDIVWSKVLSASGHSDAFVDIEPTSNAVIAIGMCAGYLLASSNESFGYGWVARLGPADGATLSTLTFGDPASCSGFYGGRLGGSTLRVGGWTQRETSGGPSRAWWCALDLNSTSSRPAISSSAPARPGEASVRDHPPGAVPE